MPKIKQQIRNRWTEMVKHLRVLAETCERRSGSDSPDDK